MADISTGQDEYNYLRNIGGLLAQITPAQWQYIAAQFAPGAATTEALGRMPSMPSQTQDLLESLTNEPLPSVRQNIQQGNYGTAALQGLGLLGDATYGIPILGAAIGPTVGSVLKAPRAVQTAVRAGRAVERANDIPIPQIIRRSSESPGAIPAIDSRKFMQDVMGNLNLDVTRSQFDAPPVSLSDLEGKIALLTMADRTPSGGLLHGINDVQFETPQSLGGGRDYMFNETDYPGQAWANSRGYVTSVQNAMARDKANEYVLLPFQMGSTSVDFPTMLAGTHLRYARQAMSKADAEYVDSLIRQTYPEFPGINSSSVLDDLGNMTGPQRKSISNAFDMVNNPSPAQRTAGIKKVDGALSNTEARIAVTDPSQYADVNDLSLRNVGIITGESAPSPHETYSTGFVGQGLGVLDRPISARDILPDLFKNPPLPGGAIDPRDAYTMRLGVRTAPINEGLLKRLGY